MSMRDRPPATRLIYGFHPVMELLGGRPEDVERIFVAAGRTAGVGRLLRAARQAGVPVTHLPREVLARKIGARASHQGVAAQVSATPYADPTEICRAAAGRSQALLLLVDGVVDPGNLGSIVRTAAAAGADGVLLGRGSVGLTPAVAKVSAGAVERIPLAREPRPARRLRELTAQGFTVLALDPRAARGWDRTDLTGRLVIVIGGEERGPRPGVARACTGRLAIPLAGGVESLNVGVATGVVLFEALRQRRSAPGPPKAGAPEAGPGASRAGEGDTRGPAPGVETRTSPC